MAPEDYSYNMGTAVCVRCGKVFVKKNARQKSCSSECAYAVAREKGLKRYYAEKEKPKAKVCPICGKEFASATVKFCSEECKKIAHDESVMRARERAKERRKQQKEALEKVEKRKEFLKPPKKIILSAEEKADLERRENRETKFGITWQMKHEVHDAW